MSSLENQDDAKPAIVKIPRIVRTRLRKALPTDRATFSKQLDILRAAAAASGPERKPVSNDDVSKIVNIHFGTISNCNPFFLETGLLTRQKLHNVPSDEVFAYAERYEWEPDKAAYKLAPLIRKSWFCSLLTPKLTFRSLSIEDAVSFLAGEAGASKEHKDQLAMLIEYLRVAGIISVEGGMISLVKNNGDDAIQKPQSETPIEVIPAGKHLPNESVLKQQESMASHHPFIAGLLKTLPEPEAEWSIAGRVKWLQTASNIFGLIYTTKDNEDAEFIEITKKTL